MKPKKREPSAPVRAGKVAEVEWNFGKDKDAKERVPDDELVACCYWEYARESNFIRRVVQRMKDVDQRKVTHPLVTAGKPWVQTHCLRLLEDAGVKVDLLTLRLGGQLDYSGYSKEMHEAALADPELERDNEELNQLYSLGPTTVELFRQLPFPKPWQSLTLPQHNVGKDFVPKFPRPVAFPPFQVCHAYEIAGELFHVGLRSFEAQQAKWQRLAELSGRGVAGLEESADLRKQLSEPQPPLLVRGGGGVDSFVAQINWREFSDTEIVECFKRWLQATGTRPDPVTEEPKGARGVRGGRGHGEGEWRASLERVGLLRLRSHYTFSEAKPFLSKLPQATKTTNASECNREAGKAVHDFHALFPFLDPAEEPRSWPLK